MDFLPIKDLAELGAVGILAVVIFAILWFGGKTISKISDSLDRLTGTLSELAKNVNTNNQKIDSLELNLHRLEDKFDRLREDIFKFNFRGDTK